MWAMWVHFDLYDYNYKGIIIVNVYVIEITAPSLWPIVSYDLQIHTQH